MNWLEQLLPPALVRALGWTLVHSLWQGAVVALALAGLLLLLRRHSAEVRYRAATVGLLVLLLLAGVTFLRYYTATPATETSVAGISIGDEAALLADGLLPTNAGQGFSRQPALVAGTEPAVATTSSLPAWLQYFDQNIPVLVAAWLLGLLAMTLRLLGGLAYVQRLRRYRVQPLGAEWQARLAALATKAGLTQPIELLESALVRVPVVVGHLRPVVLLPLGTVTGLSTAYLEAILAHELAHVQRRDYLLNLLQSIAETVFFYHPAVWFITACVRTERENCCDDAATALIGGNPLTVARALAALAELSVAPEPVNQFAMSALGPDGSVLGRIRRLVQGRTAPTFSEGFMAACVVLGGLVLLTSAVAMADPRPVSADQDADEGTLSRLPFLGLATDTTRKKPEATTDFVLPDAHILQTAPQALAPAAEPEWADAEQLEVDELTEDSGLGFATSNDADDKDKPKKRRKRGQQVVVVQEPRRGSGSTVVIEKDKKGRLTNLTVDGQPIDTGKSKKLSKSAAQNVEVIRLPGNGRTIWSGNSGFGFNGNTSRNFVFTRPSISENEIIRIQRDADQVFVDASRQFGGNQRGYTFERGTRHLSALQGAERALRNTLRDGNLNDEQRQRISQQLAEVQRKQEEFRKQSGTVRILDLERGEELQDGERSADDARREAEAEMRRHSAEMRRLDAEMRRHELEMRRNEVEMRRLDSESRAEKARSSEVEEALRRELRKDGLIKSETNFQMELNATSLTVNGKKQSAALRDKYLRLVESKTGRKLGPKSTFGINRQEANRTIVNDMVAPPRPPRAPMAPPAPDAPAPGAPMAPPAPSLQLPPPPPAPPAPPRFDSDEVRKELRKDGVLGASEKSFQFQLNDSGMTVNGKKQPEALAKKYRKLLELPAETDSKSRRNIQISINE
ncbi:M56 family metallopeptidase [Hymenobacter tenuis]